MSVDYGSKTRKDKAMSSHALGYFGQDPKREEGSRMKQEDDRKKRKEGRKEKEEEKEEKGRRKKFGLCLEICFCYCLKMLR